MRIPLFLRVLPVYVLIALLVFLPFWQKHEVKVHAQAASQRAAAQLAVAHKPTVPLISGTPVRIIIGDVGVDVPIVNGSYDAQNTVWSVSGSAANYATNTALLNNKHDATLIYGHWTQSIFGPTKNLVPGQIAYIYTDNGHLFQYRYIAKQIYAPSDTTVFQTLKGKPGLALMTCQGLWAQERRIMYFELVSAV